MEAMVSSLGYSGGKLGHSISPPGNMRCPFSSPDVSFSQSASTGFVTRLSVSAEHQQRPTVLKNGVKRVTTDRFVSRADLAISSCQFDEHPKNQRFHNICHCQQTDNETDTREAAADESEESWGVQIAIAALKFYKREISPLLPGSCRYVPTCSEYSMQAYRTYGVFKGTVLTAWRLARCNPLGGSGFDPPRWFGEPKPPSV